MLDNPIIVASGDTGNTEGQKGNDNNKEHNLPESLFVSPGIEERRSFIKGGFEVNYEKTDPREIMGDTVDSNRDEINVLVAGVLNDAEKDKYDGVSMPFTYFVFLKEASKLADERNIKFNVIVHGLGRVISQFGIERVFGVLVKNKHDDEVIKMLSTVRDIERYRAAISTACAHVCGYENFGHAIGSVDHSVDFKNNGKVIATPSGRHILRKVRAVSGTLDGEFDFFHDDTNTTRTPLPVGKALMNGCLCAAKRALLKQGKITHEQAREMILYGLTEAAIADDIITNLNGLYVVPKGSDVLRDGLTATEDAADLSCLKGKTITELLRMIYTSWLNSKLNTNKKNSNPRQIQDGWLVKDSLNGIGMRPPKKTDTLQSSGPDGGTSMYAIKPAVVDPYYSQPDASDDRAPLRIPGLPYVSGWLQDNLINGGGLPRPGIENILPKFVRVIKDWLLHEHKSENGLYGISRITGIDIGNLITFMNDDNLILPPPRHTLAELDMLFEIFARQLCKETIKVLLEENK